MTVAELLQDAVERLRGVGVESARLDAELLLGMVLEVDRTSLLAHADALVGDGQVARFQDAVGRRLAGEPVAYIRGMREFRDLAFGVDRRALIPRPETELLVDLAEREIVSRLTSRPRTAAAPPVRVVDVGTGSGAIAVALAVALRRRGMARDVDLLAVDISSEALAVAMENAVGHGVADAIRFVTADLLPPGETAWVDVCCANLPYVSSAELATLGSAIGMEPRVALDGGTDGLDVVRALLDRLAWALAADGVAFLEIGSDQADRALTAARSTLPGRPADVLPDLAGRARVLRVGAPAPA